MSRPHRDLKSVKPTPTYENGYYSALLSMTCDFQSTVPATKAAVALARRPPTFLSGEHHYCSTLISWHPSDHRKQKLHVSKCGACLASHVLEVTKCQGRIAYASSVTAGLGRSGLFRCPLGLFVGMYASCCGTIIESIDRRRRTPDSVDLATHILRSMYAWCPPDRTREPKLHWRRRFCIAWSP